MLLGEAVDSQAGDLLNTTKGITQAAIRLSSDHEPHIEAVLAGVVVRDFAEGVDLLGDLLKDVGRDRIMLDMDRWGYSFRLGSARRWFEEDAEDAREWLLRRGLINDQGRVSFSLASNAS